MSPEALKQENVTVCWCPPLICQNRSDTEHPNGMFDKKSSFASIFFIILKQILQMKWSKGEFNG